MKLKDKVAIITGGSSGIGKSTAELFAKEGSKVAVVAGKNIAAAQVIAETIRSAGGEAHPLMTDVSDETQVKQMLRETLAKYGRIDILVNSAGIIGTRETIDKIERKDWDQVFEVDVTGPFLCIKHCIPVMLAQGKGAIVNLSSVAGFKASLISPCLSAAKGAIIALTKSLALAYAQHGIRINCISPGTIDTPMARRFFMEGRTQKEAKELMRRFLSRHPVGRFGTDDEVARGVLYLASEDSSFVTGINLIIDGGLSL
jgi:NAD(P)-dependent dehydrogenase (short-subunit alcohol dehydrogenase family)